MDTIAEESDENSGGIVMIVENCSDEAEEFTPPICHGWLIVCEENPEKMMNREVKHPWHAGYCVFDPMQNTICCYKQETPYHMNRNIHRNNTVRMDGGRMAFAKHWGLLPGSNAGSPISGSHTIARSFSRPPKEHIPIRERFFSISRMPSRLSKYSTVRAIPPEYLG